jgi:hypothetical protein
MFLVFAVCVIPVHVWLVINFLDQARGIAIRVSTWDFLGVIAYILTFALVESLVVFLAILLIAFILPSRIFRSKFVALSSIVILVATGWFVYLQYHDEYIQGRQFVPLAVWGFSFIVVLASSIFLIHRSRKLEKTFFSLAQRLAILSILYIFVDMLGVTIIILRNL